MRSAPARRRAALVGGGGRDSSQFLRSGSTWAHHRIRGIRFGLGFALVFALVFAVFALVFALVFAVVSAGPQAVSRAPRSTGEELGQPGTSRDNLTSAETTCRDNLPRTLTLATNETVAETTRLCVSQRCGLQYVF